MFDTLADAGHGAADELGHRYTRRQLNLLYQAALRRQARVQADRAEAMAFGYGACKSKDGKRALEQYLAALRKD